MRLAETKIKQAILHPDKMVREEALLYFTKCFSPDPDVMPLAIQSIEKYGRNDAFTFIHVIADLAQTDATLDWAIQQLNQVKDRAYCLRLSRLVCQTNPQLLLPREQDLLKAPGFGSNYLPILRERLQLLAWDDDQCWKELESVANQAKDKHYAQEIDFEHAMHVVEALARKGEKYADRMLTLLGQKIERHEENPMAWMEIFLVMLAGEMRLEPAIPLIVAKLRDFGEVLAEQCVIALAKIGTNRAALALSDGFLNESWDYRLYASGAFDAIHADATVEKCLELLPHEKELDLKSNLADGVLSNFASEGTEPIRQLILRSEYDPQMTDLQRKLIAAATMLGVTFPEFDDWKKEAQERQAVRDRKIQAMERSYPGPTPASPPVVKKSHPAVRAETKVGRNDPCPCGSGKKFKKCCMNRGTGKGLPF